MAPEHSLTLVVTDLVGIFVFAVTGALVAVRKELDVFGVLVLALTTGLGGGFIRDVLIGVTPPAALQDSRYLLVPVVAGILTFWFHPALGRIEKAINVFDAAGLALFAVAGALKAMDVGLGPLPATVMGLVTGVGGGMLRDLLAGRVPAILQRGELYAIPTAAGAAVAAFGREVGFGSLLVATAGAALCFVWRILAMWRHWHAPMPRGSASV
ncbi:trimeric intracellular cation channel family protein [Nocardioides panacihumi]|uniref:Trimeric intracellular cation channel family protein n=1 Tax=Nocardioides panacihumi TaxID=400774 RepID=A0ABP5CFF3_9ACTN